MSEYRTPQITPKLSIPTYRRTEAYRSPHGPQPTCSPLITWTFLGICVTIIVFQVLNNSLKGDPWQPSPGDHPLMNSKAIVAQYDGLDLQQINQDYQLSIPTIEHKTSQAQQQDSKTKLQQALLNIRIFQLIGSSSPRGANIDHYLYKIRPLSIVRHPKFTSPSRQWQSTSSSISAWLNPFHDDSEQYQDANLIFQPGNTQVWRSNGHYLTVVSDQPIKPVLIVVDFQPVVASQTRMVGIYGISAYLQSLASKNTLELTLIKKALLKAGRNTIECDQPECVSEYSMVMLTMESIDIAEVEIWARKGYTKAEN